MGIFLLLLSPEGMARRLRCSLGRREFLFLSVPLIHMCFGMEIHCDNENALVPIPGGERMPDEDKERAWKQKKRCDVFRDTKSS